MKNGVQELVLGYRALSDPTRLRILHLLGHQPLCVCHLQDILYLPQVPVSQHLAYLRKAGWVESGRHAQWKVYRLLPSLSPGLRAVEILSKVVYRRQVHPHLIALGKGVFWIAKGCAAGGRTLRYGQEAIRHKRTTSRATRGPLPFIPFAS